MIQRAQKTFKLSLSETIQVQEPRKAVHDLSQKNTIWLSLDIHLATIVTWIYVLLVPDLNGKLTIYLLRTFSEKARKTFGLFRNF